MLKRLEEEIGGVHVSMCVALIVSGVSSVGPNMSMSPLPNLVYQGFEFIVEHKTSRVDSCLVTRTP